MYLVIGIVLAFIVSFWKDNRSLWNPVLFLLSLISSCFYLSYLFYKNGYENVQLAFNEFQILRVLFEHAGNIVARDDLMRELWNSDFFIDDNTLSVNVARLRKKLEEQGLVGFIETKKGIGYGLKHA